MIEVSIPHTMVHAFHVGIAKEVGVNAAVIFYNICFWVSQNMANDTNFKDGYYWTHNTVEAFSHLFPEFTKKQISTALNRLEDEGYILSAYHNKNPFVREKYYTVQDQYFCFLPIGKMANTNRESDKYINYINSTLTDNNTLRRNNFVITPRVDNINTHSQARRVVVEDVKAILDSAELDDTEKQNVLFVFECYMSHYEQKMHREHPPINRSQLTKIINDILTGNITNEEYEWIIEMHFENNYTKQINYNMIHFMTGRTRELLLRRTL